MCVQVDFNEKLRGMCNYNLAFVVGSKNLQASSFKDHVATHMHKRAMLLFKKQSSADVTEYTYTASASASVICMCIFDFIQTIS